MFGSLHDSGQVGNIFCETGFIERCLQFERSLAKVQAELGIIPREAAQEIAAAARVENIDLDLLKARTRTVGLPVVGLVDQLVALCRNDLGQYVHYGATTQDVMDSALAMQMREALGVLAVSLQEISARLDSLAAQHARTLQAGRTNQQHALPLTFGFKAAVWNAAVRRHLQRLQALEQQVGVGQLGGAVGTLASLSGKGQQVRHLLMRELGLREPEIAWHAMRDVPAEAVGLLCQIAGSLGKIGRDLLAMSSTEVGEVAFAANRGASSTMPQKSNPVAASSVVALARMLFHTGPMVLEGSLVEHERSLDAWYVELHAVPLCFGLAGALVGQALAMLDELVVDVAKMQANTHLTGGAISAESVQMELARHIGLNRAHELVSKACQRARREGLSVEMALSQEQVPLAPQLLQRLLDPTEHIRFAWDEVQRAADFNHNR
ncbi:MAG TPA: adenylosuccinate lyase family protein [Ramlibacter sp.]|nr:adenylosuccinate lyase family protein [Ramlibacter sp.]